MFSIVVIISVLIVLVVLLLAVLTTSKAYTYKHSVDPISKESTTTEELDTYKKESKD